MGGQDEQFRADLAHDHRLARWVLIDVMVRNQAGDKVATGEAMVEFPGSVILKEAHKDLECAASAPGNRRGQTGPQNGPFALTFGPSMA